VDAICAIGGQRQGGKEFESGDSLSRTFKGHENLLVDFATGAMKAVAENHTLFETASRVQYFERLFQWSDYYARLFVTTACMCGTPGCQRYTNFKA